MATKAKASAQGKATEVTSASEWKKSSSQPAILTLPSGKNCRIRKVGFQTFIRQGMIPNSLLGPVQRSLDTGKELDVNLITSEPGQLEDMLLMIDDVVVFCLIEPQVMAIPLKDNGQGVMVIVDDEDRDPDTLYVDEVDEDDKMFIFSVATGGAADLESFRNEQAQRMVAVPGS